VPPPQPSFHIAVYREFIRHRATAFRAKAFDVCRLRDSPDLFVAEIESLVSEGKFVLACEAANCMGLHCRKVPNSTLLIFTLCIVTS
jgi:hypothetical protein